LSCLALALQSAPWLLVHHRADSHSSCTPLAYAVRGYRLRFCSFDDSGVFLFRMASGLVQLAESSHATFKLISATIADGVSAGTIILAMSLGLIIPKMAIDRLSEKLTRPRT
jgi:hypothetical protein